MLVDGPQIISEDSGISVIQVNPIFCDRQLIKFGPDAAIFTTVSYLLLFSIYLSAALQIQLPFVI